MYENAEHKKGGTTSLTVVPHLRGARVYCKADNKEVLPEKRCTNTFIGLHNSQLVAKDEL